jgi:hypothetical protein
VQTAIWMLLCLKFLPIQGNALSIAATSLAWPITLAVALRAPRFRRLTRAAIPAAEDLGFESAAVLMSLLGCLGMVAAALFILAALSPRVVDENWQVWIFALIGGLLLARSFLHARAGIGGVRGAGAEATTQATQRYCSFAVTVSVIASGALLIQFTMDGVGAMRVLLVSLTLFWLLAWPLLLRRFFTEKNFSMFLAGDQAPHLRRAPDGGLTALAWLLLAAGAIGLASSLTAALLGASRDYSDLSYLLAGFAPGRLERSPWWSVGASVAQLWAGVELLNMSERRRIAVNIYGAIAIAVALYLYWPILTSLEQLTSLVDFGTFFTIIGLGQIAVALVLPIGSVLLLRRDLRAPASAQVVIAEK